MSITQNPAPHDGNRALEIVFAGVKNYKEHTGKRPTTQLRRDFLGTLAAAPNENIFPIICRHWPVISKQQLLAVGNPGCGGVV